VYAAPKGRTELFLWLRRGNLKFVAAVIAELGFLNIRNATRWTDILILIQRNFDVADVVV
jgi:hypothetical protein